MAKKQGTDDYLDLEHGPVAQAIADTASLLNEIAEATQSDKNAGSHSTFSTAKQQSRIYQQRQNLKNVMHGAELALGMAVADCKQRLYDYAAEHPEMGSKKLQSYLNALNHVELFLRDYEQRGQQGFDHFCSLETPRPSSEVGERSSEGLRHMFQNMFGEGKIFLRKELSHVRDLLSIRSQDPDPEKLKTLEQFGELVEDVRQEFIPFLEHIEALQHVAKLSREMIMHLEGGDPERADVALRQLNQANYMIEIQTGTADQVDLLQTDNMQHNVRMAELRGRFNQATNQHMETYRNVGGDPLSLAVFQASTEGVAELFDSIDDLMEKVNMMDPAVRERMHTSGDIARLEKEVKALTSPGFDVRDGNIDRALRAYQTLHVITRELGKAHNIYVQERKHYEAMYDDDLKMELREKKAQLAALEKNPKEMGHKVAEAQKTHRARVRSAKKAVDEIDDKLMQTEGDIVDCDREIEGITKVIRESERDIEDMLVERAYQKEMRSEGIIQTQKRFESEVEQSFKKAYEKGKISEITFNHLTSPRMMSAMSSQFVLQYDEQLKDLNEHSIGTVTKVAAERMRYFVTDNYSKSPEAKPRAGMVMSSLKKGYNMSSMTIAGFTFPTFNFTKTKLNLRGWRAESLLEGKRVEKYGKVRSGAMPDMKARKKEKIASEGDFKDEIANELQERHGPEIERLGKLYDRRDSLESKRLQQIEKLEEKQALYEKAQEDVAEEQNARRDMVEVGNERKQLKCQIAAMEDLVDARETGNDSLTLHFDEAFRQPLASQTRRALSSIESAVSIVKRVKNAWASRIDKAEVSQREAEEKARPKARSEEGLLESLVKDLGLVERHEKKGPQELTFGHHPSKSGKKIDPPIEDVSILDVVSGKLADAWDFMLYEQEDELDKSSSKKEKSPKSTRSK